MGQELASSSYDEQDINGLVLGGRVVTDIETLDTGDLVAGTVLGRVTATKKLIKHDPDAVDGSAVAMAILVHDADASAGDVAIQVYKGGEFNISKMTFDADLDTDAKKRAIFDGTPIIVRTPS